MGLMFDNQLKRKKKIHVFPNGTRKKAVAAAGAALQMREAI